MSDLDAAELRLSYTRGSGPEAERVRQTVRLTSTRPHYGGRRWWMICPYSGRRAGKLYKPPGGDRFAGRAAWRLPYASQRSAHRDQPYDRLFRLQRKLGGDQGCGAGLHRPKGMHRRTWEQHFDRYLDLEEQCDLILVGMYAKLRGRGLDL